MQILEVIESAQQGQAMANLGAAYGISEDEARAVTQAVLPHLAVSLERNTLSRGGLADTVHALGDGHHEAILETPEAWQDPRVIADGQAILDHILGSTHKSRILAARASQATGVGGSIIEALLPILAQMLMGALSRYMKGGLGDILSKLPIPQGGRTRGDDAGHETGGTMPGGSGRGFELPRSEAPAGGYPMPPMPPSGDPLGRDRAREPVDGGNGGGFGQPRSGQGGDVWGAPAPLPDAGQSPSGGAPSGGYRLPRYEMPGGAGGGEGSGRTWNDGGSGRSGGGFPLPGPRPEGDNPYGDLSDILRRRGGASQDVGGSGGGLWSVVRNVLGSALGFGGSGFFGWLIRLLVLRIGWPMLRRMIFGQ